MKILMLIPPKLNGKIWVSHEQKAAGFPGTPGNPYLAASIMGFLRARVSGIELIAIDAQIEKLTFEEVKFRVDDVHPDLIITLMSAFNVDNDRKCAELPYPTICVICPSTVDPKEAIEIFDLKTPYFTKEGVENTLVNAVLDFKESGYIEKTSGMIIQKNGKIIDTGMPKSQYSTNNIMPAFDLFPIKEYCSQQEPLVGQSFLIISTQEGCPYSCKFCSKGRSTVQRYKTPESVVSELKYLVDKYGCRYFHIMDCEFSVDVNRAKEICEGIINENLSISWETNDRVNLANEDVIKLMKQAGCVKIFYGIESGDLVIQKNTGKNLEIKDMEKAFYLARKYGIKAVAYVMVGFMGETKESLKKTLKVLKKIKPDSVLCSILFPTPCSTLYYELKNNDLLMEKNWSKYRAYEKLVFRHDTYKSIDEIKNARSWLLNRINMDISLRELFDKNIEKPFFYKIMRVLKYSSLIIYDTIKVH